MTFAPPGGGSRPKFYYVDQPLITINKLNQQLILTNLFQGEPRVALRPVFSREVPRCSTATVMRETGEIVLLTGEKRWFGRRVKWTLDVYEVTERDVQHTKAIKVWSKK